MGSAENANKEQALVITTLGSPVQVSAGAGAGKTWTLSQRLVHSFHDDATPKGPFIQDPSSIMGITFTKKAAAELAHRVRRMLKSAGQIDVSRRIDEAWISTIDSMCGRIVKNQSLLLEINPEFEMLSNDEAALLKERIFEEVYQQFKTDETTRETLNELEFVVGYSGIANAAQSLMDALMIICDGTEQPSFEKGVFQQGYGEWVSKAHGLIDEIEAYLVQYMATTKKPAASYVNSAAIIKDLKRDFEAIDSRVQTGEISAQYALRELIKRGIQKDGTTLLKMRMAEAKQAVRAFDAHLLCGIHTLFSSHLDLLLHLAQVMRQKYDTYAQEHDQYDFSQIANIARSLLNTRPELACDYQKQFDIVMVDEFQDTNKLQTDIIKKIAGEDLNSLCTVGDEQQSIYAFRGADVGVYREHKDELRHLPQAQCITMDSNYRSHRDILAAVDAVFGSEEVFGDALISLKAQRKEPQTPVIAADKPRIRIVDIPKQRGDEGAAAACANEFVRLRDEEGVAPSSMAVLFEMMTHSQAYIDALRSKGFDVVVQGGSGFYRSSEIKAFQDLLAVLACPDDDQALVRVLLGELFRFSTDDLIDLACSVPQKGGLSLWSRLNLWVQQSQPSQHACEVVQTLRTAFQSRGSVPAAKILEYLLECSYFDQRLLEGGVEGHARYANIIKYLDIVTQAEKDQFTTPAALSAHMMLLAENESEPPATLSAGNAVKIMTIHASKGLEFDVVAVAEISDRLKPSSDLYLLHRETAGLSSLKGGQSSNQERYLVSLKPYTETQLTKALGFEVKKSVVDAYEKYYGPLNDELDLVDKAISPADDERTPWYQQVESNAHFSYTLKQIEAHEAREEQYRKYYVALTRARECLVLCCRQTSSTPTPEGMRSLILRGLLGAEKDLTDLPQRMQDTFISPRTGEKILYSYQALSEEEAQDAEELVHTDGLRDKDADDQDIQSDVLRHTCGGVDELSTAAVPDDPSVQMRCSATRVNLSDWKAVPDTTLVTADEEPQLLSFSYLSQKAHEVQVQSDGEELAGTEVYADHLLTSPSDSIAPEALVGEAPVKNQVDATEFGTFVHSIFEYAARWYQTFNEQDQHTTQDTWNAFVQKIQRIAARRAAQDPLLASEQARIEKIVDQWQMSSVARALDEYDCVRPEPEIYFTIPQEGSKPLEFTGFIDLLCWNKGSEEALIIDYKTGYTSYQDISEKAEHFKLQAIVYACAAFEQGFKQAQAVFYFAERGGEELTFTFKYSELDALKVTLAQVYEMGRKPQQEA